MVSRWALSGRPHGIAATRDGLLLVGRAEPQSVALIDPRAGSILKEVVLDQEEIASTKELVTMRLTADEKRVVIANGSDESVSILTVPDLGIVREIGLEGEAIRDAIPDPKGRYLFILGRTVHVYDFDGSRELRSLETIEPMAIAVSSTGDRLAVIGSETFSSGKATVAVLFDTATLKELDRHPLQTDRIIESAMFAAGDHALVVAADDWFAEKPLDGKTEKQFDREESPGLMRMSIGFGDLVNSQRICLPNGNGPQIITGTDLPALVVFAERPCSASGTFSASKPVTTPASLYGIQAYAIAWDGKSRLIYATDEKGYLTSYHLPAPR